MNFTQEDLEIYKQALNDKVCSLCQRFGYDEVCGKGENGICIIDQHLPKIVEAVLCTPKSNNITDYVVRLRELVCSGCPGQDDSGRCELRDLAYCTLDSFFILVVQTIEEASERVLVAKE
jgi:hypothetical protein